MPSGQPKIEVRFTNAPGPEDREKVREFTRRKSLWKRWKPIAIELRWVLRGCPQAAEHRKLLPDYCYEILAVYRRTVFKNYPTYEETFRFSDKERFLQSKTIEEMKAFVTIDWRRYGRVHGIGLRGLRFFQFEAIEKLKSDGLMDLPPEKQKRILGGIFGKDRQWHTVARFILRPAGG